MSLGRRVMASFLGGLPLLLIVVAWADSRSRHTSPLDTKVTILQHDVTIASLLRTLERDSGIRYRADPEASHTHVAVFVRDLELRKLHEQIALLLDWQIWRERESELYRVAPSPRWRRLVAEAPKLAVRRYLQGLDAARDLIRRLDRGEVRREDLARREETITLAAPVFLPAARFVTSLGSKDLSALLDGRTLRLTPGKLPAAQAATLDTLYREAAGQPEYGRPRWIEVRLLRDRAGGPEKVDVTFQFAGKYQRVHLYGCHASVLATAAGLGEVPLDPSLRSDDPNGSEMLRTRILPAAVSVREQELPPEASSVSVTCLDLHRKTGLGVLADWFPHALPPDSRPARSTLLPAGVPLGVGLSTMHGYGYVWNLSDGVVRLRTRNWPPAHEIERRHHEVEARRSRPGDPK